MTSLLTVSGIVKEFPGVRALDGVDLDVHAGEVHCLLGQNGAGKSTLIKVLAGAHRARRGRDPLEAASRSPSPTPVAALRAGLATIYQELDLVDGLCVAENVFLGHEVARWASSRRGQMIAAARPCSSGSATARSSRPARCARCPRPASRSVSMARALSHEARLIIMDEPSAVLDADEVDNLFRVIRRAHGRRRRRHLHLPPARGDPRDRRPGHGAQGRPHASRRAYRQVRRPTERGGDPDDRPHVQVRLPDHRSAGTDAARDPRGSRASAGRGSSPTSPSACMPGRSSAWPGWSGPGARRSWRRCSAPARRAPGTVDVDGRRLRPGSVAAAVRAGLGLAPRSARARPSCSSSRSTATSPLASLTRFARAVHLRRPGLPRRRA